MWGKNNAGGGGFGGLNFAVVGGTSTPANPKENTIWVNTDAKITGWAFSAAQPAEPVEGMVWIEVSLASQVQFNALKKNAIMMYPILCHQYVSGVWDAKGFQVYQHGDWQMHVNELVLVPNLTDFPASAWGGTTPTVTLEKLTVNQYANWGATTVLYNIDLTTYSTLRVVGSVYHAYSGTSGGACYIGFNNGNGNVAEWRTSGKGTVSIDATIDVSELVGEHSFVLGITSGSSDNKRTGNWTISSAVLS